jgi:hypothetical protein
MAKLNDPPRPNEVSGDWTENVQTRVSKRARAKIKEQASARALTESAYVRRLIYKALGLVNDGED